MTKTPGWAVAALDPMPLHAMLSAALVAFTIECDSELERRVGKAGGTAALSLVVWLNALQYLAAGPASVEEICARTHTSAAQVEFVMAKLTWWAGGYIAEVDGPGARKKADGGRPRSAREAVTPSSTFRLTDTGRLLADLWPSAIDDVQARWHDRHGAALATALKAASRIASSAGVLMPEGVPSSSANRLMGEFRHFPEGALEGPSHAHVPVQLGRALLAVAMTSQLRSGIPLALAANTLRVISGDGTPQAKIHTLSGTPPETASSQVTALTKQFGFAELVQDPSSRGKVAHLTAAGRKALASADAAITETEREIDPDGRAAAALRRLLGGRHAGDLAIRAALTPPEGVSRSADPVAVRAGARKLDARDREKVAQTQAFLADPFGTLPHYPVWEATRGFGP